MQNTLDILAVDDPAVYVYVNRKNIMAKFEEKTGIHINFKIVEWSDYYSTLMQSFEQYRYDIVMVAGHLWLREFVEKEYLLKLSNNFDDEYDYLDIMPSIREEIELNNNIYLLPSFCDGHILLYRKAQLKQIPPEVVSIAELRQIVIDNTDHIKDTFVLKAHPSEIFLDFLPYLRNEGIDAFDNTGLPLFNVPLGYAALEKYIAMKKYCPNNVAEFGNEEVLDFIQKDKCKLGVSWGGQLGQIMNKDCINPGDIGFASLETSWNTSWSFGINHLCKKQEAAEKFLQYISSKEIDKAVGAYCGNPTRKSSFLAGQQEYSWYPVVYNMLERVKPLPHLSNTGQLIAIMTDEIVKAFNSEITAKKALQQAYQQIINLDKNRG